MTISSQSSSVTYSGNGATTSFPFSFPIPAASNLVVTYTDATGAVSILDITAFSVSGIGSTTGGSVTYPLVGSPIAAGTSLTIARQIPYQQQTSLTEQGGYYPDVVEAMIDRLTMQVQQLANQISLTVSNAAGAVAVSVTAAAAAIGAVISSATSKATPVNADKFGFLDSVTNTFQQVSWANIKATLKTDITSLTALTSINGGQLAGIRNRLRNGSFRIDQRNEGTAKTFTAGADLSYCVDRWYGYCTGANVTGQRVAGAGQSQYRYQFTGAASVTGIGFGQRIAAADSFDMNSQTSTFGIDLANSLLTTVTWTAYYANTTDTFGSLAAPTRTQIATGTFTVTSTVARYYAQIAIPAAATTGVEIVLSVGAQTSGTWTIGQAQWVIGSANEPYLEQVPKQVELAICKERCEKSFPQGVVPAQGALGTGATAFITAKAGATANTMFPVSYKVTKRASPVSVITFYSPTVAAAQVYNTAAGVTTATSISLNGDTGFTVTYTGNAGGAVGDPCLLHWLSESEL